MANIQGQKKWSEVRLLETHELARGGVNGNLNEQAEALVDRTEFLNQEKASKYEIVQGIHEFDTYALFDAAKSTLPLNCTVVIGEANTTGTGQWGIGNNSWNGSVLKKSAYDPVSIAAADATQKSNAAKDEAIQAAAIDALIKDEKVLATTGTGLSNLLIALQSLMNAFLMNTSDVDKVIAEVAAKSTQNSDSITQLLNGLHALSTSTKALNDRVTQSDALNEKYQLDILTSIFTIVSAIKEIDLCVNLLDANLESRSTQFLIALSNVASAVSALQAEADQDRDKNEIRFLDIVKSVQILSSAIVENGVQNIEFSEQIMSLKTYTTTLSTAIADVLRTEPFNESAKLSKLIALQSLLTEFRKLDGFDPKSLTTTSVSNNVVVFQVPTSVVRIDVYTTRNLPTAKGTVIQTTNRMSVDGQVFQCAGTLEVQGSSSASFPKKNWTLGFFNDEARTSAVSVKLGDMLAQEELVFKSNFVDNTHCRNLAVNRLWHQMCEARDGWPKFEPDFNIASGVVGLDSMPTGATGHVDGYPAVIYINDEFYGIGSLNIGKKRTNYNLKSNDQTHIQLEPNGGVQLYSLPMYPLDPTTLGGTGEAFEIRRPSVWSEGAQSAYSRFRTFLSKSQSEMTALGIDNYLDRKNMMDYIILYQVCHLWDHLHKNTLYTTWDGLVWSFMPYDVDTVWGLHFLGNYYLEDGVTERYPATDLLITTSPRDGNSGTLAKFRRIYGSAIDMRYKQLRDENIISVENILSICEKLVRTYPIELFKAENERWNLVPGGTIYKTIQQTGSLNQIKTWLTTHLTMCDTYFNYSA